MTRKHYKAIAEILLSARGEFGRDSEPAILRIECGLIDMLSQDNDRFNHSLFLTASREDSHNATS